MLNVSIVLYNHKAEEIKPLVDEILLSPLVQNIYLVDNSPQRTPEMENWNVKYIYTGKNLGYGAGHNVAIQHSITHNVPHHLVLNPDIELHHSILQKLSDYMEQNADVAHIMPKVTYPNGEIQYLCKLVPSPFDLFARRFLPAKWTEKREEKFELRQTKYSRIMNVPYLSGCFMYLRTVALAEIGAFDERFFMYPEDIDLTRRLHAHHKTIFFPHATVVHHHAQASYKKWKYTYIHIANMIKYFNKWGWIFDTERKKINRKILKELNLL